VRKQPGDIARGVNAVGAGGHVPVYHHEAPFIDAHPGRIQPEVGCCGPPSHRDEQLPHRQRRSGGRAQHDPFTLATHGNDLSAEVDRDAVACEDLVQ